MRPDHGPTAINTAIIEISLDDSNSDSGPTAVPPLILAKTGSQNKQQSNMVGSRAKTKQASRDKPDRALPMVDLT